MKQSDLQECAMFLYELFCMKMSEEIFVNTMRERKERK